MIILHKSLGIAAAAEAVAHTDAEDGDRAGLGDDLCHSRAEAAENVGLFRGDYAAGLTGGRNDGLLIERLDGVDVEYCGGNALGGERFARLQSLLDHKTGGYDGDIAAGGELGRLAELKMIFGDEVCALVHIKPPETHEARPVVFGNCLCDKAGLIRVAG